MNRRELLVIGVGGLAKEAAQLARIIDPHGERWQDISYVADQSSASAVALPFGRVKYCDAQVRERHQPADVVIAIGHPAKRAALAAFLTNNSILAFPNLIHPSVELDHHYVRIGRGNMVTKGVVATIDIAIGDFNLVNWNATIGHDTTIGSYNVINPGANIGGNVVIVDECLIGAGSQIVERRSICSGVTIGAGAVVTSDIATAGIYLGIPARKVCRK